MKIRKKLSGKSKNFPKKKKFSERKEFYGKILK